MAVIRFTVRFIIIDNDFYFLYKACMKTILIFGASNGLGKLLTNLCLEKGYAVHALVRRDEAAEELTKAGVIVTKGDALNPEDVAKACQSVPKDSHVFSTLGGSGDKLNQGPSVNYQGQRNVIDAVEQAGLGRFIMITSVGCGVSWTQLPENIRSSIGVALREKTLSESWLQTSGLDYTIVRPGGLLNGDATGKAILTQSSSAQGLVNRKDVAALLMGMIDNEEAIGQTYTCIEPGLTWQKK